MDIEIISILLLILFLFFSTAMSAYSNYVYNTKFEELKNFKVSCINIEKVYEIYDSYIFHFAWFCAFLLSISFIFLYGAVIITRKGITYFGMMCLTLGLVYLIFTILMFIWTYLEYNKNKEEVKSFGGNCIGVEKIYEMHDNYITHFGLFSVFLVAISLVVAYITKLAKRSKV